MKAIQLVFAAAMAMAQAGPPPGTAISFADLPAFADDDHVAALATFRTSCGALTSGTPPLRSAAPPPAALKTVCDVAATLPASVDEPAARRFFETHFSPRRIGAAGSAFLTGYYEPVVDGSLAPTETFKTPLYGRPADSLPLPDRAGIESGALGSRAQPLVFVHDSVDAFFIQVQGSARIALPDGTLKRLVYAGRNGYRYTSIGKILVQTLHIPPAEMGMAQLSAWIRSHGQGPGEAGTALMQKNRSYIFFAFDDTLPASAGPIGGSGVSLSALRSLAIDRTVWPYGLPIHVEADLPWQSDQASPFHRLMVAQDTGSAIIGPARADIFFGTGPKAAHLAGAIRHTGTLVVLWPQDGASTP